MIVDASAVIAILRDEPEALSLAQAIASARSRRISAVNYVLSSTGAGILSRAGGLTISSGRLRS